jgi:tetratricopeptide (TPR) repeat protein
VAFADGIRFFRRAGERLDEAIELEKHQANLYRFRARIYRKCGEPRAALRDLDKAILLSRPPSAEDWAEKGRIWFELDQYDRAQEAFQTALTFPDARATIYLGLANSRWMLAENETDPGRKRSQYRELIKALGEYLRSVQDVRSFGRIHRIRGLLRLKLSDYADAIGDFNSALEIEPASDLYALRGWARLALREYPKSVSDFENALQLDRRNFRAIHGRALAQIKGAKGARDIEQAIVEAREALESEATHEGSLLDAARVYAQAVGRGTELGVSQGLRDVWEKAALDRLRDAVLRIASLKSRQTYWEESVRKDSELAPIRRGPSFQRLEAELFPPRVAK